MTHFPAISGDTEQKYVFAETLKPALGVNQETLWLHELTAWPVNVFSGTCGVFIRTGRQFASHQQ